MSGERNPLVRFFGSYAREYVPYLLAGVGGMLFARVAWFFPPVVLGVVFDSVLLGEQPFDIPFVPASVVPSGRMDQFLFAVGLITAAYIIGVLTYVTGSWLRAIGAYRIQHDARVDAYSRTQRLSYEYFENKEKGQLISVLNNDINQLESMMNGTLQLAGNAIFIAVVVAGYMLYLNWQLALLAFVAPAIIAVFNFGYSRYVEPKYQDLRDNVGDISSRIENNISGISIIKAYTREQYEISQIEQLSEQYKGISWRIDRAKIALGQITGQLSNLGYVFVLLVGGVWVLRGPPFVFTRELTAGTLLTFLIYNDRFTWPLSQITNIIDQYQGAKASCRRVYEVIDDDNVIEDADGAQTPDLHAPRFEFEDVSFRYESSQADALSDITFTAEPEETIGIVGPTGAGKSTLLKLLFRFYDPTSGRIMVDGTNLKDIDRYHYRDAIGYVSQDPYLFSGSVKENIRYGAPNASRDEIVEAAEIASAHEFITDLDDGYDTNVGEGGNQLSGGQRQRIAIARAVVGDPPIMILDEATSDVDNETKAVIQESLAAATEGRTTFVVAHNLSTVKSADNILVLEDGEISEKGDHESLVDASGVYAELWRHQTGNFEENVGEISEATND